MKGIVLAGGNGSRLQPLTVASSKGILPVYDKPMIYYPITTLMMSGIREICVISSPEHIDLYKKLLRDGSQWGIFIEYIVQLKPNGIAESLLLAEEFVQEDNFALILGDNLIYGAGLGRRITDNLDLKKSNIFCYQVSNPQEYGIVEFENGLEPSKIIEKPKYSKSNWAIPGLYFLRPESISIAKEITPSNRGELEITSVLQILLENAQINVIKLQRGTTWLDLGDADRLLEAAEFVRTVQKRQGLLIGSPEEISWRMGWINKYESPAQSSYYNCLEEIWVNEF